MVNNGIQPAGYIVSKRDDSHSDDVIEIDDFKYDDSAGILVGIGYKSYIDVLFKLRSKNVLNYAFQYVIQ